MSRRLRSLLIRLTAPIVKWHPAYRAQALRSEKAIASTKRRRMALHLSAAAAESALAAESMEMKRRLWEADRRVEELEGLLCAEQRRANGLQVATDQVLAAKQRESELLEVRGRLASAERKLQELDAGGLSGDFLSRVLPVAYMMGGSLLSARRALMDAGAHSFGFPLLEIEDAERRLKFVASSLRRAGVACAWAPPPWQDIQRDYCTMLKPAADVVKAYPGVTEQDLIDRFGS